jgi:TonB family protein
MSPRSLLFSSDQETSRLLTQALHELELQVESCNEIFAALKSLTSRAFDLVVVDWDEGLEASFLLKTARELKSNRSAFAIVIGRAEASAALEQAGADLVLSKPVHPDRVRHALLSSNEFMSHLKLRLTLGRERAAAIPHTGTGIWPTPVAQREPAALGSAPPLESMMEDLAPPGFATLDAGFAQPSLLERFFPRRGPSRPPVRPQTSSRSTAFLRVAAIGVAFFAVGYTFSQPLTKAGRSAAQISRATWEKTQGWFEEPRVEAHTSTSALAEMDEPDPPPRSAKSAARIRVMPVRPTVAAAAQPAGEPAASGAEAPPSTDPGQMTAAVSSVHIPESIASPFPGVATVRNVAASITPVLLNALEPITVPEQLSEKLLLEKVEPNYPEKAVRAGLQGPVVLQAWIGRDGRIRDLKLIRGSLLLGQAACEAVKQWRYKPYLLNGQAVEAETYVTVDFTLP